jgi:hypothetical protein
MSPRMKLRATQIFRRSGLAGAVLVASLGVANAQQFGPPGLLSDSSPSTGMNGATDAVGNWVVVWDSEDSLGGTIGGEGDILVARSNDNGSTWAAAAALNTNASADSGLDFFPQVTNDSAGNWVAVWSSTDNLGGTIGNDLDILVARSTDNGATWTAPAALNTNAASDNGADWSPQVTTDGAGNWVAVWFSNESFGYTIGPDNEILIARSTDNGATWTAPAALNTNAVSDTARDVEPQIATDEAGNWIAVWRAFEPLGGTFGTDSDILVARSTDNGATWSAPAALNTNAASDTGDDYVPQITTDHAGNWVAVWFSSDSLGGTIGSDYDVLVARSTDNGATWTAPAALNTDAASDSGDDYSPQVTSDRAGNWVAAWTYDSLGDSTDNEALIARSTDNGATWTAPEAVNTNAASATRDDYFPRVTTDSAGHWIVAWVSDDSLAGSSDILVATGGVCEDSVVAGPEQCDIGADVAGDCCSNTCELEAAETLCDPDGDLCTNDVCDAFGNCGIAEPSSACFVAPVTNLRIANSTDPARDKLTWQWNKGEAFALGDLGTPFATTTYALCLYDTSLSVPSVSGSLVIEPSATLWSSNDLNRIDYRDADGSSDGVTKLQLKTGDAGRTSVKLYAKGSGLSLPVPVGETFFAQSPKVVAQLRNSDGECWTSEFAVDNTSRNDAAGFKAQTK